MPAVTKLPSGDSYSALTVGFADTYGSSAEQDFGPVWLDTGLGIFEHGVIDQHFDRQARYGRLVATTYKHRDTTPLGFGIEENTALVVTGNTAEVLGSGGVHVIDARGAERGEDGSYANVRVSFFQQGDGWTFGEGFVNTSEKYDTIGGDEYFQTPDPAVSGVFSRNATLKHFISYDLVDNASASEVVTYLFNPRISGKGFELRFSQDETTKGYWKALDGQADSYFPSGRGPTQSFSGVADYEKTNRLCRTLLVSFFSLWFGQCGPLVRLFKPLCVPI
ncbi:MAG: hypothetical protein R3186_10085 [Ruegeria sp.]|nr:hypothetical protein [Ruegeria sp.]